MHSSTQNLAEKLPGKCRRIWAIHHLLLNWEWKKSHVDKFMNFRGRWISRIDCNTTEGFTNKITVIKEAYKCLVSVLLTCFSSKENYGKHLKIMHNILGNFRNPLLGWEKRKFSSVRTSDTYPSMYRRTIEDEHQLVNFGKSQTSETVACAIRNVSPIKWYNE